MYVCIYIYIYIYTHTHTRDFPGLINSHSDIIMFADDTSIFISSNNNHNKLNLNFKSVLIQILKWFQGNQFITNVEKQT
jgi:uncharacterized membrane protein YoaT (DUF817 family)